MGLTPARSGLILLLKTYTILIGGKVLIRQKNINLGRSLHRIGMSVLLAIVITVAAIPYFNSRAWAVTNCTVTNTILSQTPAEQTLLNLINAHRQQNGVAPLVWSQTLKIAAAWMSNDMVTNNRFNHTDSVGRGPGDRLTQCGYTWTNFGENIYPNSSDPTAAFNAWKESALHNANMLDSKFKEAGVAANGNYWTLDLGASSSSNNTVTPPTGATPTIPVNTTNSPTVTISTTQTPTPMPSITLDLKDTQVKISIKLPGIGISGNKSPKHLTRHSVVEIFNLENKKVLSGSGFLKYNNSDAFDGVIHLGQLAEGVYYVKVSSRNTLTALVIPEFQILNGDNANNLPTVTLTPGDVNEDNVINIKDFNIALTCFQNIKCPTANEIDMNDDGSTNVIDYNIFLASFKRFEGD